MSDNKKYYYLKLKEDFFDSDAMIVMESMPDGYKYSNILLKLYLRSLKHEGKLMFNDRIPYNSTILSQVTRHSVGDVERAIKVFEEMNLIEILDNGAIFISDIQNFVGRSSTEGDRKREYRRRIEEEREQFKLTGQTSGQMSDKRPPEIEIELERDIEIESPDSTNVKYDDDSPYLGLAKHLFTKVKENNSKAREPNFQNWADDIRKLVEIDGNTVEEVKEVIDWCQSDSFWKNNVMSANKLRNQFPKLWGQGGFENKGSIGIEDLWGD